MSVIWNVLPVLCPKNRVGLYPTLHLSKLGQGGACDYHTKKSPLECLGMGQAQKEAQKELQCQYPVTKLQKPRNIDTTGALLECSMVSLQESHPGLCLAPVSTWYIPEGSAWAEGWLLRHSYNSKSPWFLLTHSCFILKIFTFVCLCSCEHKYPRGTRIRRWVPW